MRLDECRWLLADIRRLSKELAFGGKADIGQRRLTNLD
jgi:hypothetical protein